MPPDGSRNIFMLQPRKRERMKSKGHMSAESFSFYLGHACFYPIAQNWHTRTPIDIKEIWDCEVCLTRYMAVPEFYQLGRRVNGLGIGNWWCLPKTSCYNHNKYDCNCSREIEKLLKEMEITEKSNITYNLNVGYKIRRLEALRV